MSELRKRAAEAVFRVVRPNATWGGDQVNGHMTISGGQYEMQERVIAAVDAIIDAAKCPHCAHCNPKPTTDERTT